MLKIVIIDDNYKIVETICNKLGDDPTNQYRIFKISTDSEQALDYILTCEADVIILDLNMPKLSGIDILEIMREKNITTKVIGISGEENYIVELLKRNIKVYKMFIKPFQLDDLVETLRKLNKDKNENMKLTSILNQFDFNKASSGYTYLIDCLEICIEEKWHTVPSMNLLYQKLGERRKIYTVRNVGWNVEKAIRTMNRLTEQSVLSEFFPYHSYPSPKIFLNTILDLFYEKF